MCISSIFHRYNKNYKDYKDRFDLAESYYNFKSTQLVSYLKKKNYLVRSFEV